MIFEQIAVGGDRNFAYLVADETSREAAIVDPGYSGDRLLSLVKEKGLSLKYVINTHPHYDHNGDNRVLLDATDAKLALHGDGDVPLADGDVLHLGGLELKIYHTPGHTASDVCILAGGKLVTGDTLFVGKVGGTDLGEGARREFESLRRLLDELDDSVEVWPGHDVGVRPSSTIGAERRENPFLLREKLEDFVWLKENWLQYKTEHGID
jgi:hydroxyacylglutathione hydrolase